MADKYAHKRLGNGDRSCYKADGVPKIKHHSEEIALNIAASLRERGDNVHSYLCPVCGFFHVGRLRQDAMQVL